MDALLYAPFTLHRGLVRRIRTEKENAEQGKPARIIVKMNALYDEELVNELYAASQAGVQIDLIVRGVCQLPQVLQAYRKIFGSALLSVDS
jgi:polyphosphate kinase